jgi:hypothetical protein
VADSAPPAAPADKPGFARRNWGKLTVMLLVGTPLLIFALWSFASLAFVYSSGSRVGFAQKLSKKGWICKTWEGEIAMATVPGVMPERFAFTVWSDSLAAEIQKVEGRRIKLTYEQHRYLPNSCFGETEHFVKGVEVVKD